MNLQIGKEEVVCANCRYCKVHYIEIDSIKSYTGDYLETVDGKYLMPIASCHCINTKVRKIKIRLTDIACYQFEEGI